MDAKLIQLPVYIKEIIGALEAAGFEAYAVGGCVRDSLLGLSPHDWDVCTSAMPEETTELLSFCRVVPTGLKHGTVTVISESPVEVTTFRTEGAYTDGRRPDQVAFVKSLEEDLARRDFTVNAMAYSDSRGLVDLYGGREDLEAGILRTVGRAEDRLREDPLRILRGLRFMAVMGLKPEPATDAAIRNEYVLLNSVSMERISAEFSRLMCGSSAARVLEDYSDVFAFIIPEIRAMIGFDQRSPYHNRDVWHHTLCAVDDIKAEADFRIAMLLHDIAKPVVGVVDSTGRGRYIGHPAKGAELAEVILRRMKYPTAFIDRVCTLIRYHDARIKPERREVRRWLGCLGSQVFYDLMLVRHADATGKYERYIGEAEEKNAALKAIADSIIADGDCIGQSQLDLKGDDLIAAGVPAGRQVGQLLSWLLESVMDDLISNERQALLDAALKRYSNSQRSCFIISGGPEFYMPDREFKDPYFIVCDQGLVHADACGISPDLIIGDFDSHEAPENTEAELIRTIPEKDDTDTLMALRVAIDRGFTDITILGALGGRLDHTLANLQLCGFAVEKGVKLVIEDRHHRAFALKEDSCVLKRENWSFLSVFSMDRDVKGLTISGAKYPLANAVLTNSFPYGVSNEFVSDQVEISVQTGMILVVLTDLI